MTFFRRNLSIFIFLCAWSSWGSKYRELAKPLERAALESLDASVRLVFSPDGQKILATYSGFPAKVWDATNFTLLYTLANQTDKYSMIREAAFSPDSKTLVTVAWASEAQVWDAKSGTQLLTLRGHSELDTIASLAFSPNGENIITGSWNSTAMVWNAQSGERLLTLSGHKGGVQSVSFSPDGKTIFTADDDGTAKLWDAQTGSHRFSLYGPKYWTPAPIDRTDYKGIHHGWWHEISFSPDSQKMVTISDSHEAKVWDGKSAELIFTLSMNKKAWLRLGFFSPDGTTIFTASNQEKAAKLWSAKDGQLSSTLAAGELIYFAAFSPNSEMIVTTFLEQPPKVWNAKTGKSLFTLKADKTWVSSVKYSPNGQQIITGYKDGTVRVWNAKDGALLHTMPLTGHKK